jgi:DNA (cytosine-5)-methyltransferase 1
MHKLTILDLFCGAGGSTTGAHLSGVAKVVACINHDATAIRSHAQNYPACLHYTEDIRLFNERVLPAVDIITMSAECTHFSIAKGGESRNADSRTLSEELYRYIEHCKPSAVIVENVAEFMTWSHLVQKKDKAGKPVFKTNGEPYLVPDVDKSKRGCLYLQWVATIKAMGYEYQSRILNSADFGAYTSRKRYFGIFVKRGMKIKFPSPTHSKNPPANSPVSKWKAVRDLLDFADRGKSIFDRKTPLKENTLKRIYAGLQKFVPQSAGEAYTRFIDGYKTRIDAVSSVEVPLPTIDTLGINGLVTAKMRGAFLDKYYGVSNPQSIDKPCDTITTVDRFSLVQPLFIDKQFTNCEGQSVERPLDTIMSVNKFSLVQGEYSEYSKAQFCENDSPEMRKIKGFMQAHGISDIFMRMLKVQELKVIQGFPADYVLLGTEKDKKKFIGNSVVPQMMAALIKTIVEANFN